MSDFKDAYYELLKKNTRLNDEVLMHKRNNEQFKVVVESKILELMSKYQKSENAVLAYLIFNELVKPGSEHHKQILSMLPMKIAKS